MKKKLRLTSITCQGTCHKALHKNKKKETFGNKKVADQDLFNSVTIQFLFENAVYCLSVYNKLKN